MVCCILSGLAVAACVYESRALVGELAREQKKIQMSQVEHNKLLIEKGLYGSFNTVERKARKELSMITPQSSDVVVLVQ